MTTRMAHKTTCTHHTLHQVVSQKLPSFFPSSEHVVRFFVSPTSCLFLSPPSPPPPSHPCLPPSHHCFSGPAVSLVGRRIQATHTRTNINTKHTLTQLLAMLWKCSRTQLGSHTSTHTQNTHTNAFTPTQPHTLQTCSWCVRVESSCITGMTLWGNL